MIKYGVSFLGSTSIGLLITAVGLAYNTHEVTYAGIGLFALVASGWLLLRFDPRPDPQDKASVRERRRELIRSTRSLVANQAREPDGRDFRNVYESSPFFPALRRHFSSDFLARWNDRRTIIKSEGGPIDPFANLLLDEVDGLERKWNLENS